MRPLTFRRTLWTCIFLAGVLLGVVLLALRLGAVPFSLGSLGENLWWLVTGQSRAGVHRFSVDHGRNSAAAHLAGNPGGSGTFGGRRGISGIAAESAGGSLRAWGFQRLGRGRHPCDAGRAAVSAG